MDNSTRQKFKERGITMTAALKKAVNDYNLSLINLGSLSYRGSRYVKSKPLFCNEPLPADGKHFILEFHHVEHHGQWSSWETPLLSLAEAMGIWEKEETRRLWDSRQFYYITDSGIYNVICMKPRNPS